ncbi:hypothetical protein CBR_g19057, partial [Chara braunii]
WLNIDNEILKPEFDLGSAQCSSDPTEQGLLKFAVPIRSCAELRNLWPKMLEIPFNSNTKFQLSIHRNEDRAKPPVLMMKGAPERVFDKCRHLMVNGKRRPLDEDLREGFAYATITMAQAGERVLGFAVRDLDGFPADFEFSSHPEPNFPVENLTFVGLISLIDPPREGVAEAVRVCQRAGIKVFMVTGDHPVTAEAIAKKVGILENEKIEDGKATTITGDNIRSWLDMDEEAQIKKWDTALSHEQIIFARVSPAHKLLIVEHCQRLGHIVAVTGDGVNDAPALKKADVGVAMGKTGRDLSRDAADLILMDDNFASIVAGVERGRVIFDNLKKTISYTLTMSFPQLIPFLLHVLLNFPQALPTVLMLVLCLGTDLYPAIALAYEEGEEGIMKRPPRNAKTGKLVTWRLLSHAYLQIAVLETLAGLFAYFVIFGDYGYPRHILYRIGEGWEHSSVLCTTDSNNIPKECGFGCNTPNYKMGLPTPVKYCEHGCKIPMPGEPLDPFSEFDYNGFRGKEFCSLTCLSFPLDQRPAVCGNLSDPESEKGLGGRHISVAALRKAAGGRTTQRCTATCRPMRFRCLRVTTTVTTPDPQRFLGSGSTQDWMGSQLYRQSSTPTYTDLLEGRTPVGYDAGLVDLSFGLRFGSAEDVTHTILVNPTSSTNHAPPSVGSSGLPDTRAWCSGQSGDERGVLSRRRGAVGTAGVAASRTRTGGSTTPAGRINGRGDDDEGSAAEVVGRKVWDDHRRQSRQSSTPAITRGVANINVRVDDIFGDCDGAGGEDCAAGDGSNDNDEDDDGEMEIRPIGRKRGGSRATNKCTEPRAGRRGKKGAGDTSVAEFKTVHKFMGESGKPNFFTLTPGERKERGFDFRMDERVYSEMKAMSRCDHTIHPTNLTDTGVAEGVQMPCPRGGRNESGGSEGCGGGQDDDQGSTRDSTFSGVGGGGGDKRKNVRQQTFDTIADVMKDHGNLMATTVDSASKRQCSILTRQCDILERELEVQKEHYVKVDQANFMMCNALLEIAKAILLPLQPHAPAIPLTDPDDRTRPHEMTFPNVKYQHHVNYFASTGYFVAIIVAQFADLMICKTRKLSIFGVGLNKFDYIGLAIALLIALLLAYVPPLQYTFLTRPLFPYHWLLGLPLAFLIFWYGELRKLCIRRSQGGYIERVLFW